MSEEHNNAGAQHELHWLYRPESLPKLWRAGYALLALTIVANLFVDLHAAFGFADWFSFNALYGFFTCLLMVVFAKGLGLLVKRPEDYYEPHESTRTPPALHAPIDEDLP